MNRAIFCTYWLYFFGFRGVLGHVRLLDYMGMSLVVLGLMHLLFTRLLNWRLAGWVTILFCPLFLTVIFDPSIYIALFVLRSYVVALYFACYFKSMRLTIVELVCFAIPLVVSVYYFQYPRPLDELYLLKNRMAGISEPNFTSLSLIYVMCGAFGTYVLTGMKRVKVTSIMVAIAAFLGVILTASRAGFIGATIGLCLFMVIEKSIRYAVGVSAVAAVIIALDSGGDLLNKFVVFQRFQGATGLMAVISQRPWMELAWNSIYNGEWFIGGGPIRVSEWGIGLAVPHNSFLDIGIEFGKASFYFYSAIFIVLLVVNVLAVGRSWRCRDHEEKVALLTPLLFLSLLPMYMTLSTGMTMIFIQWMVLGAYPLLHTALKAPKTSSKKGIYHYIEV